MTPISTKTPFMFAGGVLHIDMAGTQMRFRWAPEPLAEEKNPRGGWKRCWPAFRLLQPSVPSNGHGFAHDLHVTASDTALLDQKRTSFDGFRASIPAEVIGLTERFGSHQWPLLELLGKEPDAVDLAMSNPVLAYSLANNALFRGVAPGPAAFQAMCYCKRKQRWIAAWLGFPDSEAVVKFLKKIVPEAAAPSLLQRLQIALKNRPAIMKDLAHLKRINTGVLELVVDQHLAALATPRLLTEVSESEDDGLAGNVACVLSEGLEIIRKIAPTRKIKPFARMAQVQEFVATADAEYLEHERQSECARLAGQAAQERHRRELAEVRRAGARQRREAGPRRRTLKPAKVEHFRPFPSPPVPGTPEIVPVLNSQDLRAEGLTQYNCVGSYDVYVFSGTTYIYRVLYPQRATLSIILGHDGCWRRGELKAAHNAPVRQSTKSFVDDWLSQYRLSV